MKHLGFSEQPNWQNHCYCFKTIVLVHQIVWSFLSNFCSVYV